MEENNQTMNLGNIVQQQNTFATPVNNNIQQTVTVNDQPATVVVNDQQTIAVNNQDVVTATINTMPSQGINIAQNFATAQVNQVENNIQTGQPVNSTTAPAAPKQPIETDKYIADTRELVRMLSSVCKIANHDSNRVITESVILKFTNEGLEVIGTDSVGDVVNGSFIMEKSTTYKYKNEVSFGIDSVKLPALLSKTTSKEVEFIYNAEERIITVIGNGEYKFSEAYDTESGESLKINIPEQFLNIPMKTIEGDEWKKLLKKAVAFIISSESDSAFSGVYSSSNICASNAGNAIYVHKNIPSLQNDNIFCDGPFIQAYIDQLLEGTIQIGFVDNVVENYHSFVVVKGDKFFLASPTKELTDYRNFPIDQIESVYNRNYTEKATFDKNSLIPTLERVQIFMNPVNGDNGELSFDCTTNNMRVESIAKTAKEDITLNDSNITPKVFRLNVVDLLLSLKSFDTNIVTIKFDPAFKDAVCLSDGETDILLAVMEG